MKRGVLEEGRFVLCFPILFPCFSVTWRVSSRRSAVCNSCGREAVCPSLFCRRSVSACFVLPSRHSSFVVENRCVCVCVRAGRSHTPSPPTHFSPSTHGVFPAAVGQGRARDAARRRAAPPHRGGGGVRHQRPGGGLDAAPVRCGGRNGARGSGGDRGRGGRTTPCRVLLASACCAAFLVGGWCRVSCLDHGAGWARGQCTL